MWPRAGMATAAAAAVDTRPTVSLPTTLALPRWVWEAAVERTPAAVRAQGTHSGARPEPCVYTRQSSQNGRRHARHMPAASSKRCLSHFAGVVVMQTAPRQAAELWPASEFIIGIGR